MYANFENKRTKQFLYFRFEDLFFYTAFSSLLCKTPPLILLPMYRKETPGFIKRKHYQSRSDDRLAKNNIVTTKAR